MSRIFILFLVPSLTLRLAASQSSDALAKADLPGIGTFEFSLGDKGSDEIYATTRPEWEHVGTAKFTNVVVHAVDADKFKQRAADYEKPADMMYTKEKFKIINKENGHFITDFPISTSSDGSLDLWAGQDFKFKIQDDGPVTPEGLASGDYELVLERSVSVFSDSELGGTKDTKQSWKGTIEGVVNE